ncbi:hypothetical protein F66182_2615 [Fusarium sp. NRRL 66182]|nr:hypothetical protein F66182_2615 [Fusarium sp. NRRL 66182]
MKSTVSTLLAVLYARCTVALTSTFCPDNGDVCFRWGVPEAAASSGSGNVYFQISAPDTAQWAALGIGSQMSDAEMFIIYQDGQGNVTLSPRRATGHNMPQYSSRSGLELLDGSGVSSGNMIANIRCSDCDSLDLQGSNLWISAWRTGDSLDSTSTSENIQQHDEHSAFDVDFSEASITSDRNPFASSSQDSNSESDSDSSSGSSSGSGAVSETASTGPSNTVLLAHGIIMSIVFLVGYPLGAILMPMMGKWFIHAGWQTIALLLMWAGFGLGYVYARDGGYWWKQTHTKMGTIVVVLITMQPVLGWLHHRHFVNHGKRGIVSHVHIWFGRALLIIGIVNGGLGLQLASSSMGYIIAYSVIAGIAALLYIGGAFLGGMRKTSRAKEMSTQMSQIESRSGSS